MALKQLVVKQTPDKEIPTEVLADSILAISKGMQQLRSGRLNDRALVLLIHDSCPSRQIGGRRVSVTQSDIKKVLDAIEWLAATYLKKKS